jgi:hypothetical protein
MSPARRGGVEDEATVRFDGRSGNATRGEMLIEESDYLLPGRPEKR